MTPSGNGEERPVFSICVPQYNRTSFFIKACLLLQAQTLKDFEVCISDDCSTDGRSEELSAYLKSSGLAFVYKSQPSNLRYDANLRASMRMASGQYLLLMGNDDALSDPSALQRLKDALELNASPEVAFVNYKSELTGEVFRRARRNGILGSGPSAVVAFFRSFSFVSGVLFRRTSAEACDTSRWDGSEMYQMYVGCRILAAGGRLLGVDQALISQGLRIQGEEVDSYLRQPRYKRSDFSEKCLPMHRIAPLVIDALKTRLTGADLRRAATGVYIRLMAVTYVFWLFEYRRVQSWAYAFGIYRAMNPQKIITEPVGIILRTAMNAVYVLAGAAGLLFPVPLFNRMKPVLHCIAKTI